MKVLFPSIKRIFLQILLLLLCYFLSRCIFTLINFQHFGGLTTGEFLYLSFAALRFDISSIVTINAVYFFLFLLPAAAWRMPMWERFTQIVFIAINALAFAFEISDWAYFPFALKRSTSDVLNMVTRKGDFIALLPHFIIDYWFVPIAIVLLITILIAANRWIVRKTPLHSPAALPPKRFAVVWQTLNLIVILGLCVIGMRGGLQLIPLTNGNALQAAPNQYVPIVLNTPFSIMHSYSGKLEEVKFFDEKQLKGFFDPVKHYEGKTFTKKNVVIIILESFSKEYTGLGGRTSFTPFLDSLMGSSFVCRNAYANSVHSAEGVPAVISGMPALMDEPITTSAYGTDKLTSLPSLLKTEGYQTAFFHGGTNGTMSFDIYASNAGFDKYYGRTEYGNEADYDGNWGIWDEPFLQFFARTLGKMKEPFAASVFTLSSHDPFKVPALYQKQLPKGSLPIHQTIAYTDLALKEFFQTAAQQPWYQNTLFVITADHAAPVSTDPYYSSYGLGRYAIPIIFFSPKDTSLRGTADTLTQQIDILPSVLDYLGYSKPFFAFGNSVFRKAYPRFVVNELSGHYLWYMNGYLLTANELVPKALYDISRDSLLHKNILDQKNELAKQTLIPYFKAFIQLYRSSLINNQLTVH
jgi:phosphoglycerol transferase MdoB-like AlkP superfamily enzyme